jgi:hypothetical protein
MFKSSFLGKVGGRLGNVFINPSSIDLLLGSDFVSFNSSRVPKLSSTGEPCTVLFGVLSRSSFIFTANFNLPKSSVTLITLFNPSLGEFCVRFGVDPEL